MIPRQRPSPISPVSPTLPAIATEVVDGLFRTPKSLPPKLLYDDRGSALFEQITCLPEYYPTRTEAAILSTHADEICSRLGQNVTVAELGAGTATKTRILLRSLLQHQFSVNYFPLDVSAAEFAVNPDEKVFVERSGDACAVVIRRLQDAAIFYQICPKQELISSGQMAGDVLQ